MRVAKRFLSLFLSFALLMSMCSVDVFAYDFTSSETKLVAGTTEETMPTLTLELVESDGSGNIVYGDDGEPKVISKDDIVNAVKETGTAQKFMVMLKATNYSKFIWNGDGIYVWAAAFSFDPSYISWEPSTSRGQATALKNRIIELDPEEKWGMAYDSYVVSVYTSKDTEGDSDVPENCTKTATIQVDFKDSLDWIYILPQESVYLSASEFSLNSIPEDAASGKTVLTFSKSPTDLCLQFGETVEQNLSYNNETTKLEEYLKLDESQANFFPKSYTVEFYNSYDSDNQTYGDKLDNDIIVGEGSSVSATIDASGGTTALPEASDFTAPTGKYYSKLQYLDKDGNVQDFDPTMTLDSSVFADSDTTLEVFATYQDGHNVTFNSNYPSDSGRTDTIKVVTVAPTAGATIATADEPTIGTAGTEDFSVPTGYVFKEWNTDSNGDGTKIEFGESGTDVSSISDVYAIWTQAIKVEFVKVKDSADAGNVVETYYIDPNAADKTVAAPATDPTREGYVFDKWCYDVDGTATDFVAKGNAGATEFSENTTVYATWKKSVKVIYYDTDKTTELKNETIVTGDSFTPPTVNDDTANNKYFNGWKKVDDDTAFDVSQPLSADITSDELKLYVDMKDAYTVKFYKEAEKTNLLDTKYSNSVTPAALGDANMPTDPTETGKKFSGWKVVGTDATFDETTVVNGDMEVYAAWDSLWKIDFYEDDDDTTAAHTKYVDPDVKKLGSEMPAGPAARTGYRFEGYYIDGTNTKVDGNTEFSGDTKVVGKWTQLFEVEFYPTLADAQAGTNKLAAETVDSGNKVSASTVPTVNDDDDAKKYFKGWKTVDGAEFDPVNDTVTSDLKLYEDWGDYYKVEFYKEATDIPGTVYDTKYVNPNEATTLSALPTDPTKTGFGFNEWKVYADGAVTTKFDTSTTVSGNMTVVADWIQKVKISFYPNDGTGAGALGTVQEVYVTPNVTFDGTVPTVTRTGYTLKEWNTASNGSGTSYANVAAATFTADTTLYAIWTANGPDTATLTFDANLDGVTPNPSSVTVNVNDKVYSSNIPVVTKTDYTFDGWYASPEITDTTPIDFSAGYTVTENKTVYAHWTYIGSDAVIVNFDNDGTKYATVTVAPNTTLGTMMPADPTKTGFAFKEWNTASDGQGTKFESTTNVGAGPATVTVYSQWIEDITVTYDANTGTGGPGSVTAPAGDKYVDPTTLPTKTNYEFAGWNTKTNGAGATIEADGSKTYADIAAAIDPDSSSVTVYAQWVPADGQDTATLTFDTVGGDAANPASITVVKGDTIVASQMPDTPTKTSETGDKYTFLGWYEAATLTNTKQITAPITMDADKTAYAHWDYSGTDKITITFNDNGATTAVSPTTINIGKGDSIGEAWPTDPEKTGFTFGGWYTDTTDESTKKEKTDTFTADTTLNAKWVENITITYDANQGSNPPAPVTKPAGDKYVDPDTSGMSRTDYYFTGWNTEPNGSGTTVAANGTLTYADVAALDGNTGSSITLYAMWDAGPDPDDDDPDAPTIKGIQVIFNTNATGTGVVDANPNTTSVDDGDAIGEAQMPDIPVRPDHQFLGWNTQENGGGLDLTGTSVISTTGDYGNYMFGSLSGVYEWDLNVYAQWKYTGADAVTVNFMNDGSQYATITVAPNTTLDQYMPDDPEKTGFAFKEWNTAENGSGTKFESTTNVGAGPATVTVYAQWVEDITVNYNANGGDNGPASVTKPAADTYEDPDVTNMAKGDYTFVGWNTKQNGSGTYVAAGDGLTYADVADMFTPAGGTAPTEVTVYAQWAWTPDDDDTIDDIIDDTPVDPDPNGVRVTFDSNSAGATTAVVDANPKYKYPQLGDAIGTDNMPEAPTREKYTFKGWNTAQDGSGVTFTGTTTVDSATLGDALVEIMENDLGTGKYEVTLYAQWEVASDVPAEEKVTITFNKNLDGSGAASDLVKTVTLYKGDALGYDVAAPTNGTYEFNGWYAGSVVDGKVSFTTDKFTSTTAINADTDYYAQWQMYLLVQVQPKGVDGAEVDYTYTGLEIKPQYKVFQITYPNGNQQPYEIVDEENPIYSGDFTDSQFKVEYKKDGSIATLKDAGVYTINASFADGSVLQAAGAQIAVTDAPTIEIKPAGLTFKVDPESQIQKGGDVTLPTPASVEGIQNSEVADTIYGNVYYAWTDSDNDNNIADAELATTTTAEDVGKYVWKIELKSSNYVIEKVESSVDGKDVLKYGVTADYPTYTGSKEGQNLVLEVIPNDPSIKTVVVESVDNKDEDGNPIDPANKETLGLKKNDYTTDETFDNAEEPTITDYYIRVTDKDAEEVTFTVTLTNPETTTLTATGGTAVDNGDGTWTVTAPLTNKGATTNEVTITTKAGDAEDAPTITYTFTIQQLVEAKITLNYGNSPYGEIMKDAAITDKDAAKAAFNSGNKFTTAFLPTGSSTAVTYTLFAWGGAVDSTANMDRNDYAVFVYQKTDLKDPGFTATDSLGNAVDAEDITRTIKFYKLSGRDISEDLSGTAMTEVSVTNQPADYTFTNITSSSWYVRPDIYDMEYTFVDPQTGETVKEIRKVVVLIQRGDTNIDNSVNGTDQTPIINRVKGTPLYDSTTVPTTSANLFVYRTVDTNMDGSVNGTDQTTIINRVKGTPITPFYNTIQ